MKSYTVESFWIAFNKLSDQFQFIAKEKYKIWKENPFHPSLRFKCVNSKNNIWSVRINRDYRGLGVMDNDDIIWYWIGSHKDYEKLIKRL